MHEHKYMQLKDFTPSERSDFIWALAKGGSTAHELDTEELMREFQSTRSTCMGLECGKYCMYVCAHDLNIRTKTKGHMLYTSSMLYYMCVHTKCHSKHGFWPLKLN